MLLRVRAGLLHSIVTAEAKWYGNLRVQTELQDEVPKTGYFPKWVLTYFPSFLGQAAPFSQNKGDSLRPWLLVL